MTTYDIEYYDNEGDILQIEEIQSLSEAKQEIKEIRQSGGSIKQTWKYVDGVYKGSID
jgi:hypothetical protein